MEEADEHDDEEEDSEEDEEEEKRKKIQDPKFGVKHVSPLINLIKF